MKWIASTQKEFHCNLNFTSHVDGAGPRSIHFVCQNDFLWPPILVHSTTQSIRIVYTLNPFLIHLKLNCKVFPRYQLVRLDALLFALGNQKATYTRSLSLALFPALASLCIEFKYWKWTAIEFAHFIIEHVLWPRTILDSCIDLEHSQNIRLIYEPNVCVCVHVSTITQINCECANINAHEI